MNPHPPKPQIAKTETPKKPQANPTETPNVNVNDNVNDLEKEKIQKEKPGNRRPGFSLFLGLGKGLNMPYGAKYPLIRMRSNIRLSPFRNDPTGDTSTGEKLRPLFDAL